MIFEFLKKQKEKNKKIELIKITIESINIPEENKFLYLEALDILDDKGLDKLYKDIANFMESYELKELDKIQEENFSTVAGMRKKEAIEKQKDINAFSFLINNL